ncbi:thymidylate synthase [Staphylococcus gallinarum]|uniref:Thymidylate synthase n=1 Tax=Staphylococcus gallinarum TaxID=1293 RepID=A0A380FI10_STAGA|nr:thymidylate synthase [Staphylococcus gallinarum]
MQNTFDQSYHELCEAILEIGKEKEDRTNTGTISKIWPSATFLI